MTTQQHLSPGALLANDEPAKRDRFANGHLIWQTILELRNTERRINRRALADLTGFKPSVPHREQRDPDRVRSVPTVTPGAFRALQAINRIVAQVLN